MASRFLVRGLFITMPLIPYGQLTGYLPQESIGTLQSPSEWAVWNLVDDFNNNNYPNISGFELSPDKNYLLQKAVLNWIDAGASNWTPAMPDTGAYVSQSDPATNTQGLYQTNGSVTTAIKTVFDVEHFVDVYGGFTFKLYRPSPTSQLSTYDADHYGLRIYLNWPSYTYEVGMPPLFSILVAAGEPISLQISVDALTWITVDTLDGTDSETYLSSCNRTVTFDVVPLFDISWWNDLPQSFAGDASSGIFPSNRPPDSLQISVNSGAGTLVCNIDGGTFLAGSLLVAGIGGNFGIWYANREYTPFATLSTAINQNQVPFYTVAEPSLTAYVPSYSTYSITPVYPADTIAQVSATFTVQSEGVSNINPVTGNSYTTAAINFLNLYYPPVFNGPYGGSPEWQFNFFSGTSLTDGDIARINSWESHEVFTQSQFCRRSSLDVTLNNSDLSVTPANVPLANRIVTWSIGWYDTDTGGYILEAPNFTGQISTESARKGFGWSLADAIYSLDLRFSDFLNPDKPCGYFLPFDGQNMYFVMRQIGYKLGFTDARMLFPFRTINDDSFEFHLDSGSSFAPKWQPHPEDKLVEFALRVRDVCGAPDPTGSVDAGGNPIIVPMVLYVDSLGNLRFEPWSIGWANNWASSSTVVPVPAKTYTIGEQYVDGQPQLASFLALSTSVDLSVVRTNIQLAGRNPITGQPTYDGAVNNLLDGSTGSNPYAQGYLGYPMDLFLIDAQYTSQEAISQTLGLMEQQVSTPVISAEFTVLLQPGLHALSGFFGNPFIAIYNYGVTGDNFPVPFWVMSVSNKGVLLPQSDGSFTASATSSITARGVGQAGS